MNNWIVEKMKKHIGHQIEVVQYGQVGENITLECKDCNEVIIDSDVLTLKEDTTDISKKVVIELKKGLINVVECPEDIDITIQDYDIIDEPIPYETSIINRRKNNK